MLLAIGLGAAACGGDGDPTPTASPSPTATATNGGGTGAATGTATPIAYVVFLDARPVEVLPGRAEFPRDLALVVRRSGELWRIHRAPDGTPEERLLFDPFAYSSTRLLTYWDTAHLGPALPPGQLAIVACTEGECLGQGTFSEDALVSFFTSIDGGASWAVSEPLDGTAIIATATGLDSFVLQRLAREGDTRTGRFEQWPSGIVVDAPTAARSDRAPVLLDRRLAWWTGDGRLIDDDGRTILDLGDELTGGSTGDGFAVLPNADASRLAVTWEERASEGSSGLWRWSVYERTPEGQYAVSDILEARPAAIPTVWLSDSSLLLNATLTLAELGEGGADQSARLPLVLDLDAATLTAIDVPGGTPGEGWAVAAQQGPFAEINAGEGDCLNLRTAPSLEGSPLRCIAHAALVERLSPLDGEWVNVRTSDGVTGWVSGEFVRGSPLAATPTPEATATATATPDS